MSPAAFWAGLTATDRDELGNDLVLGMLDWRDWLSDRPPPGFWGKVDELRLRWEEGGR